MPTINLAGKTYEVDEDGFLQELDKWSEDFASSYAKEEGIDGALTDEHWKIINYLRDYYAKIGIALQGNGFRPEKDLRALSLRTGQGSLQAGRLGQADRVRLKIWRTVAGLKPACRAFAGTITRSA
jgi:hypothetical protein